MGYLAHLHKLSIVETFGVLGGLKPFRTMYCVGIATRWKSVQSIPKWSANDASARAKTSLMMLRYVGIMC